MDIDSETTTSNFAWAVTRIGWAVMGALVISALLGFSGGGGAFSRHVVSLGGVTIDSPAISRWSAADRLTVTLPSTAEPSVVIPSDFADTFAIETVSPNPEAVIATAEGLRYRFAFAGADGERSINFSIRAERPALLTEAGSLRAGGERFPSRSMIVLP